VRVEVRDPDQSISIVQLRARVTIVDDDYPT